MKITALRTVVVNAGMRNWIFVRVDTDVPGLFGWGEGSLEWKTKSIVGAIEDFAPMVIGEDPQRIEHLYQKMYRQSFWRTGVIGLSAISAIEQALWDIKGKDLDVPVYQLLGGRVRDKVRMYTTLGGGDMSVITADWDIGPLLELAHKVIAQGYTAIKVLFVPHSEPVEGMTKIHQFAGLFRKLREAVGERIDIMIDFHGRTYPAMAVQYINAIAEFRPFFCEEPVPPENVDSLLEVRQATRVPIATGERLVTRHQFRELFEKRACHVVQPDLCHCGGLWEARKIAAMAEVYDIGVAPHNPLGPVANAAALHFALATPNFLIQEDMMTDVPWRWDVVQSPLRSEKGYWLPCEQAGLGIEVNEEAARKHPYAVEAMPSTRVRAADGAILDW
ncbi:MAG: galactonate dehydratase [Opitutus sp.]|nr:galactonate dehydratase [Opitutus sp.]